MTFAALVTSSYKMRVTVLPVIKGYQTNQRMLKTLSVAALRDSFSLRTSKTLFYFYSLGHCKRKNYDSVATIAKVGLRGFPFVIKGWI